MAVSCDILMLMKLLILTGMLLSALLFPLPSYAHYNINLQNGEVLEAEDCRVEGNRINLKFKVGYASFPLSMVQSVTDQDGKATTFSSTGEPEKEAPPPPAPAQTQPANAAVQPAPAAPSSALDPLTTRGGTNPAVDDGGKQEDEETGEEEPPNDDESTVSEGATELP